MPIIWTLILAMATLSGFGQPECASHLLNKGQNKAKGRPAFQSSNSQPDYRALKAVDGNCDGDYNHGSCTHTDLITEPWWYVDLGTKYYINAVVVKNREDCCGEKLLGAQVHVGNFVGSASRNNSQCGLITDGSLGSISTIFCHGKEGRYVSIVILGQTTHLHVCEVEVYVRGDC